MRIQLRDQYITVVDTLSFPEIINKTHEIASHEGLTDQAFYICDLGDVVKKHYLWCEKLPRVEPFYAIKCNPDENIIELLANLGIGFDCASKAEIMQVLKSGVPAERIIFANPCKIISHLNYACENNVRMLTFDSEAELQKIAVHHPSAQVVLRIFVGVTKARCPLGLKFGSYMEDVPSLLSTAKSLNLDLIGVSFHVGSGCFDPEAYRTAIMMSHEVFEMAKEMGMHLNFLDLGGGFPGNLDTPDRLAFFLTVCDTINTCLEEYFPPERQVRIIAEPGRYYVSSAFQLACTVTSFRYNRATTDSPENFSYYLNDGVYGSFNCNIFDHYIGEQYVLKNLFDPALAAQPKLPSIYWGPTCDSMDKIMDNFTVRKLEIGECVAFRNMGAYTMAAGSTFNGFSRPYIRYYSSIQDWMILSPLLTNSVNAIEIDEDSRFSTDSNSVRSSCSF